MPLSIGIVGLPNVGKSTLFTALTRKSVGVSNYPFCTIEPNVGVVPVPDPRLDRIAELVRPPRVLPATVEFVDIAGLVKGASEGEGLGNRFLANIREVDAVAEVVRFFSSPDVVHVDSRIDPASDVETVRTELVLADLDTVGKALPRLEKESKRDKAGGAKLEAARRAYEWLDQGHRARRMNATDEERRLLDDLHLLTMKPMLYVANVDEADVAKRFEKIDGQEPVVICAEIEAELTQLSKGEAEEYLGTLGLHEPGLDVLVREAYRILGLRSFFTHNENEARAWTVPVGATAYEAAGRIHTDFQRGFVKAEVVHFADFDELGSEAAARTAGKLHTEGRDHVLEDGDLVLFRFNA